MMNIQSLKNGGDPFADAFVNNGVDNNAYCNNNDRCVQPPTLEDFTFPLSLNGAANIQEDMSPLSNHSHSSVQHFGGGDSTGLVSGKTIRSLSSASETGMSSSDQESEPVPCTPGTSFLALKAAICNLYSYDDFDTVEFLGDGFFSTVYKVRHKSTNELCVLKINKDEAGANYCTGEVSPRLNTVDDNKRHFRKNMLKEVELMKQLKHENVLEFVGVCVHTQAHAWSLYALTEYCDLGSLQRLIMDLSRVFVWRQRVSIAVHVAKGMQYIHDQQFMHRDLTSMNVLLKTCGSGLSAVVGDFGLACKQPVDHQVLPQVGTPYWMAPECLKEEYYDAAVDVFSYGVVLCQMIARIDADPEKGFPRTPCFGLDYVLFSSQCPPDTNIQLLRLAFECCLMDPSSRPQFSSIVRDLHKLQMYMRKQSFISASHSKSRKSLQQNTPHSINQNINANPLKTNVPHLNGESPKHGALLSATSLSRSQSDAGLLQYYRTHKDTVGDGNSPNHQLLHTTTEQLAATVAAGDPFYEPQQANPFADHEKYKDGRKITMTQLSITDVPEPSAAMVTGKTRSVSVPQTSVGLTGAGEGLSDVSTASDNVLMSCSPVVDSHIMHMRPPKLQSTPVKAAPNHGTLTNRPQLGAVVTVRRSSSLPGSPIAKLQCHQHSQHDSFDEHEETALADGDLDVDRRAAQGQLTRQFTHSDQQFAQNRYKRRFMSVTSARMNNSHFNVDNHVIDSNTLQSEHSSDLANKTAPAAALFLSELNEASQGSTQANIENGTPSALESAPVCNAQAIKSSFRSISLGAEGAGRLALNGVPTRIVQSDQVVHRASSSCSSLSVDVKSKCVIL